MNKKLFVGSLPFAVNDDDLKGLFEAHGEVVSAKVIMDKRSNRSKGYGFVEMGTEESAQAAVSSLNESEFKGRKIVVSEAKSEATPEGQRPRRTGGGGGGFRPRKF